MEFQRAVQEALHQRGRHRLDALHDALTIPAAGEYLPAARSTWVDRRREELRSLVDDALIAAAEAAFELGDLRLAERHVQHALRHDPYRETAWRLSMKIAGAMGHDDRVIARYRACQEALAELSVTPADSTRELLKQLRR